MKILFLAPQPFFQDRGTPIAVKLALEVLAARTGEAKFQDEQQVDLLTYHEGKDIPIPGVNHSRIKAPSILNNIRPGISVKKLLCDVIFLFTACRMVWAARRSQYDLVHAVEESVFIAMVIRLLWRVPYIYDMDSSLALQVTEKWSALMPILPALEFFERLAVKFSTAVVPVCDALAVIADRHGSNDIQILRDISLLDDDFDTSEASDIRADAGIGPESVVTVYIGNLEHYQGIDLLIDGFKLASSSHTNSDVVVIGGAKEHIEKYEVKVKELGLEKRVHFLGAKPISHLTSYLQQADILASPRTRGNNTPMKIYSYLHSGKPIIATDLPTHTQVLTPEVAVLTDPTASAFSDNLLSLLSDKDLRVSTGKAGYELAERCYTFEVFSRDLNSLYDRVGARLGPAEGSNPSHQAA